MPAASVPMVRRTLPDGLVHAAMSGRAAAEAVAYVRRRSGVRVGAECPTMITGCVVDDRGRSFWITREANAMYEHSVVPWLPSRAARAALEHVVRVGRLSTRPPRWGAPRAGVDAYLFAGDGICLPLVRVGAEQWCVLTVAVRRASVEHIASRRTFRNRRRRRGNRDPIRRRARVRWSPGDEGW